MLFFIRASVSPRSCAPAEHRNRPGAADFSAPSPALCSFFPPHHFQITVPSDGSKSCAPDSAVCTGMVMKQEKSSHTGILYDHGIQSRLIIRLQIAVQHIPHLVRLQQRRGRGRGMLSELSCDKAGAGKGARAFRAEAPACFDEAGRSCISRSSCRSTSGCSR